MEIQGTGADHWRLAYSRGNQLEIHPDTSRVFESSNSLILLPAAAKIYVIVRTRLGTSERRVVLKLFVT